MQWFMAMLGAVLGLALGGTGVALLGLGLGALLGWQWGRISELRQRLDALESRTKRLGAALSRPPATAAEAQAPVRTTADVGPAAAPSAAEALREPAAVPTVSAAAVLETLATPVIATPPEAANAPPMPPPAPPVPRHAAATQTSEPGALERVFARIRDWFLDGNVPVKIGVLVLLFGVAAALKYSIDAGWLHAPVSARLALIAVGGLAAIVWGWRNRAARPGFGLSLQGGGIGILLLTVFAAFRLYQVLPAGPAFGLVLALVAGSAALAVLQDAMALAVLGFLGGYLAPVLLSTGAGSHVAQFSFYAVLNLAVFVIAWLRHWRALNLMGFFFTFAIGLSWGAQYYQPQHFATVEPFLILFFLFYVAVVVLHAWRAPASRRGFVDGTVLFGTPLLAFPLQAAMLHEQPMALAWSALAAALLYAVLAFWVRRDRRQGLLGQSFGVLAVGFATLAIPLALSARTTSVTWALEGAALVWLGLRQRRLLPQLTGIGLHVLAGLAYAVAVIDGEVWRAAPGEWLILNGHALGVVLLAATAFMISWLFERAGKNRWWVWPGFLVGSAWWVWAGLREIQQHAAPLLLNKTMLFSVSGWVAFAALSLLVMGGLRRWLRWPRLGWNVLLALLCSLPLALASQPEARSALEWPLAGFWLAWVVATLAALAWLREPAQRGLGLAHVLFLATLGLAYGLALQHVTQEAGLGADWVFMATVLPLVVLLVLTWRWPAVGAFPLAQEFAGHASVWFVLAGIVLALAWFQSLFLSGDSTPLAFMPLLNPAELPQLVGLLAVAVGIGRQRAIQWAPLLAVAGFTWLSLAGLRAVHQYADLPWSPALLNHGTAQATLTVLWAIAGVVAWISGSRRRAWGLWLVGAISMGVVLVKLVLVDRQYVGNIAGIVSFMAVGGLLVLVGRIAPTPPRRGLARQEESE